MVQGCQRVHLGLLAYPIRSVGRVGRGTEHLDGDQPVEQFVVGSVDLSHASAPDQLEDAIAAAKTPARVGGFVRARASGRLDDPRHEVLLPRPSGTQTVLITRETEPSSATSTAVS